MFEKATNLSNFCQTCLCTERSLYPVHKLCSKLNNLGLKINYNYGVCWECKAIIMKFLRFKAQVIEAQNALMQIVNYEQLKSLSKLSCHNKYIYDLEIQYSDPLTNVETEDKQMAIKLEAEPEACALELASDCDIPITESVKQEDAECKENDANTNIEDLNKQINKLIMDKLHKSKLSKAKNHIARKKTIFMRRDNKLDYDDVKDKFETVVFKEEEMLKNREEKRNQPNFKKIPYKCDSCVLGFTRRETFEMHMEKKHNESVGQHCCDVCRSRFPMAKLLERHTKKHYVVHRCLLCDYDSLELWSAVGHCRSKHSGDSTGSIHCHQCSAVFRSPQALSDHMKDHHTLRCSECGDNFKGKHTLRTHKMRIHGARRDFACDSCGKTFKTKSRLESHVAGHNSALAKKLAYCNVCNVQYKNIYVYRNHLRNSANHSERSYECNECNKKFASKVYWRKHCEFYHLHKSQYKCEMCNKLFISDWRLKNHRQTHHGLGRSRNHACNVCGKKFFTLSTLRGHQLTHSEQRTYMCEDCGDTFKQRPALYTHSRLVHRGGRRRK